MNFQPRGVLRAHVRLWFVEALELSKRRVWAFLALGLAVTGVVMLDGSGMALPCMFPLVLSIGCAVAKSADHSTPVLETLGKIASRAWVRVFIVGAAPWVVLALIGLVLETVSPGASERVVLPESNAATAAEGSGVQMLVLLGVAFALMASVVGCMAWMTRFLWFFWTLCTVAELPLTEAFDQAEDGASLNGFVLWPYLGSVLLLLPVLLVPPLFFPWLAITTSMMYIAFRDVWLARTMNNPASSTQQVGVPIESA